MFSAEEYRNRIGKARELMSHCGMDALFITGDSSAAMNYVYLSGHLPRDYQSNFSRPHILILPKVGDPALVVFFATEKEARSKSFVKDIRTYQQPFTYEAIERATIDLGLQRAVIGAELGTDSRLMMPLLEFMRLQKALPDAKFVDASNLMWDMRKIKSEAEIQVIKQACNVNGKAIENLYDYARAGMTEIELAKKLVSFLVDLGAYRPPHTQITLTSSEWSLGFVSPKEKKVQKGDILFIDSGCIIDGYWGEFLRMGVVGSPDERQARAHDQMKQIVHSAIRQAIKPGKKMSEVVHFVVKKYADLGLDYSSYKMYVDFPFMHIAHGIGLNSSEPPLMRMDNDEILKPGMVFTVECYAKNTELYGVEEAVVVTEDDGCEILWKPTDELYVVR